MSAAARRAWRSVRPALQVWAAADGKGTVLAIGTLCAEHVAWMKDPDFYFVPGLRMVRVRARALIKAAGTRCCECVLRDEGAVSFRAIAQTVPLTASDVEQPGGAA